MTDWDDRIVDEHTRRIEEMRKTASFHMKYELYKRPEFKFYLSMGIFNFFQGFKNDDLDLGVFHFYWDRNAENTIEYHDPETGERTNNTRGDWRERWYSLGEKLQPVEMDNPYRPDPKKLAAVHAKERHRMNMKMAKSLAKEHIEYIEENQPWKNIPKPFWMNEEDE